jgi:translation initiation factor IF-3
LGNEKFNWRINHQIRAPQLRLIGSDGKQLGIVPISEALTKAHEEGLDLIEIAPNANPPVAKITEIGKFRYQEEKRLRKQKVGSKGSELKEVRFSPFIAQNDYNTRLGRVKEFLADKDKVRLVVVFTGRQMGSKQFGYSLLARIIKELGESIVTDMEPKFIGKHLIMTISPTNKVKKILETPVS